ncbi:MAG TPA: two-component regulator propeller domain-containing protein [Candidatus Limnocylindria bacterium]|nr:two-component regulator propeller domain-containing protein [Candidatus Limnocylindria bacterium]
MRAGPTHRTVKWRRPGLLPGLVALLLGGALTAWAGTKLPVEYSLRRWSATEQLPFSSVEAITQTRDGFLWFAMNGGLGRFDGVTLEVFDSRNTAGFPVSYVNSLVEAADGGLWVGTAGGGLLRFREGRFEHFSKAEGLGNDQIKALCLGREGRLWIGTDGGGVFLRHPDGRFQSYGEAEGLPEPFIASLQEDEFGRLIVLTFHNGAYVLKGNRFEIVPVVPKPDPSASFALTRGRSGHVWLGGGGIYRLEVDEFHYWKPALALGPELPMAAWEVGPNELWLGTDKGVIHWKNGSWANYATGGAVSSRTVGGFAVDHEGSVWLSTEGGGLIQLRPTPAATLGVGEGLPGSEVTSVVSTRDGSLWVATSRGVVRMDANGQRRFTKADGLPDDFIFSLQEDESGTIWAAPRRGPVVRLVGDRFVGLPAGGSHLGGTTWCLARGAGGSLWTGSTRGAVQYDREGRELRVITSKEGLANRDVRCVSDDGSGVVWLGTSYGLARLDAAGITTYTTLPGMDPIEVVIALHRDRAGALWIGTLARGLFRLKDGKFTHFSAAMGLPGGGINSIAEDGSGNIWLGTGQGLARLDGREAADVAAGRLTKVTPLVLTRADGLRSEEFTGTIQPTCARDGEGRLWFATIEGLVTVQPARVFQNERAPTVSIKQFALEGADRVAHLRGVDRQSRQPVGVLSAVEFGSAPAPAGVRRSVFSPHGLMTVRIPPGQERLDFQFVGPSFIAPQGVTYRYKLERFDEDWVEAGTRRAAYYTRVPPGNYVFHVQARNEDGFRKEPGAELAVVVEPFWWQQPTVRALGMLLLSGAGCLLYGVRIRQLRRRHVAADEFSRQLLRSQDLERARIAGELHDGLGQELQLIRNRAQLALRRHLPSPALAQELDSISETAARAIGGVRALSRGLRPPELDQLGLTQALRWLGQNVADAYAGRLDFQVDPVDGLLPRISEVDVYRIAQEALNNAVKHSGATEITFEVGCNGGAIQLSVFDNGRGFSAGEDAEETGHGVGLKTMRERAAMLRGELELRSEETVGTRLTLMVPVPDKARPTS